MRDVLRKAASDEPITAIKPARSLGHEYSGHARLTWPRGRCLDQYRRNMDATEMARARTPPSSAKLMATPARRFDWSERAARARALSPRLHEAG